MLDKFAKIKIRLSKWAGKRISGILGGAQICASLGKSGQLQIILAKHNSGQPGQDAVGTKVTRSWFEMRAKMFCIVFRNGTQFIALVRN